MDPDNKYLLQLAYDQSLPTLTSMQTNSSVYSISSNKSFLVVDIPGHPRIRTQVQEHLSSAKAIAFVVDASTISRNGAAVAEYVSLIAMKANAYRLPGISILFFMQSPRFLLHSPFPPC